MKKRKIVHSIRNYVLLWAVGFATALALLVAGISYGLTRRYLRMTQRQTAANSVQLLGSEIGADLDDVIKFANWVCLDRTISDYLKSMEQEENSSLKTRDSKAQSVAAWNHLSEELNASSIRSLLRRVIVSIPDGSRFLQIIPMYDTVNARNGARILTEQDFFMPLLTARGFSWIGLTDSVLSPYYPQKVIPVIRPIQSSTSTQVVGWVYLEISQDLAGRRLENYRAAEDEGLYLTIGEGNSYRYQDGEFLLTDLPEETVGYQLPSQDWKISLLPSRLELKERGRVYLFLISMIFVAILMAGFLMAHSLRQVITRPVNALLEKLDRIGQGDFSTDPSIEWDHELGNVGRGINQLSEKISALLEKKVQDEKKRQELEYRVLQSQVNPHFMYNTLNTIKWMAAIQGAEGIADMSTALSRLLRNISKETANLIPVEEEFRLLDDYFTIMNYRYGGTIQLEYEIEDQALLSCLVNRFCLQPIVENAIFHGIEPKGGAGTIRIHVCQQGEKLILEVEDNGIGMDEDTIQRVLAGEEKEVNDFFRQLGIGNVNQRIRQAFGEDYGIRIESEPGTFTRTRLIFPVVYEWEETEEQR